MTYTSFSFYAFLPIVLVTYYIIPKAYRWLAILLANFCFIWFATQSMPKLVVFISTIIISFVFGLILERHKSKLLLLMAIVISGSPLFINRLLGFTGNSFNGIKSSIIIPIGLSFYTMQIIAYLVDIYTGKITAQKNVLKYALFTSFFPQMIQGPIPRYEQLSDQLVEGHSFDMDRIMGGIQLIIWGFFLKFMIADKAGIVVDTVFNEYQAYHGFYVLIAGILYSIQLYADFLGCVTLSQGVASLFGIELVDNFMRPYFADSIKDFWRRWHISLSSWLRDYIYIPLGGNRKGVLRKYVNLIITFIVSGFWHGGGFKFIFWGLMHGFYQVVEGLVPAFSKKLSGPTRVVRILFNSFLVMLAWIVFRADTLKIGIKMILRIFTSFNYWIFFDGSLYNLGLVQNEWIVLVVSIIILYIVSKQQENGIKLREKFAKYSFVFRWLIYLVAIIGIWIFGTYGLGYNANDFIYGGF